MLNALSVRQLNRRFLLLVIAAVPLALLGQLSTHAQSAAEQLKFLNDRDFKICLSDYPFTDGSSGGSKSLFITIYVPPKAATKVKLTAFYKRIKGATATEENVMALFLVNRNLAGNFMSTDDSVGDDVYLKAVRGLYLRKASDTKEIFRYFSTGMHETDLDALAASEKLKD